MVATKVTQEKQWSEDLQTIKSPSDSEIVTADCYSSWTSPSQGPDKVPSCPRIPRDVMHSVQEVPLPVAAAEIIGTVALTV